MLYIIIYNFKISVASHSKDLLLVPVKFNVDLGDSWAALLQAVKSEIWSSSIRRLCHLRTFYFQTHTDGGERVWKITWDILWANVEVAGFSSTFFLLAELSHMVHT